MTQRTARITRQTSETKIDVLLDLDGSGTHHLETGVGFFDHMLAQLSRHSLIDMTIKADGDLHIDYHHAVEDIGIAIGQAIRSALGDRRGIYRYADCHLPMDETLVRAAIDVSGRPFLVFNVPFSADKIGNFDTELVREFFQALAVNSSTTLHIDLLRGTNNHHIAEATFKAAARALKTAVAIDPRQARSIPSTKGTLGDG